MSRTPLERTIIVIELVLGAFLLSLILSPLTLPEGSVTGLEGRVGTVDNWDSFEGLPWPQRAVYLIGDVNCHQQADRSFVLNGNQMPVCSRDVGILGGLMAGLVAFLLLRRGEIWWWALLLLAPMAADGGLQAVTSYESNNLARLATGSLAGIGLGYIAGSFIDRFFRARQGASALEREGGQQE